MCGVRPAWRVRRVRPYCQGRGRPLELPSRDSARGNFTPDARKFSVQRCQVFIISYDENPTTSRKSNLNAKMSSSLSPEDDLKIVFFLHRTPISV
jgi:hypothetical protein